MRKTYWMMIAALFGASALFTACEHEDNPVKPDTVDETLPKIKKIYCEGSMVMKNAHYVVDSEIVSSESTYNYDIEYEKD